MKLKDFGEFNIIDRIANRVRVSGQVIKGIGDDTAVLRWTRSKYLLFTCDMLVEGRHFLRDAGGFLVGRKSLSASISDIASMGGGPKFCLVSLGAPPSLDIKYVDDLYKGIRDVAKRFDVDLVGGDTVKSENIVINISLLGEVEKKNLVGRSGAKEGDSIFVTGTIGGAFRSKHLRFTPRLREARLLVKNFKIHSMIDVSDGLIADLGHILKKSKIGAVIYEKTIPISKDARDFTSALRDGEDFEIVFTMSKAEGDRLIKRWKFNTHIARIGEIRRDIKGLYIIGENGKKKKINPIGYDHFNE